MEKLFWGNIDDENSRCNDDYIDAISVKFPDRPTSEEWARHLEKLTEKHRAEGWPTVAPPEVVNQVIDLKITKKR